MAATRDEIDDTAGAEEAPDVAALRAANKQSREQAMIARARQKSGTAGAVTMAAMVAMRRLYGLDLDDDEAAEIQVTPTEPDDIDAGGIELGTDDIGGVQNVAVPPLPPLPPPPTPGRRKPPHL